jgi:hypothetical protein
MKQVLSVNPRLDDSAFEALVADAALAADGGSLVDARHVRWADPYGILGLLALGRHLGTPERRAQLQAPESADVVSYLGRMGFWKAAADVFDMPRAQRVPRGTRASHVLLEITAIRSHEDVHSVIELVQDRAGAILTDRLGYSLGEAGLFSMILSEVCQNIIEHAEAGGWVGIQSYNWAKRLGRDVVMIAVMDLGIGFRGSLGKEHSARFGDRWSDATALEAAFIHGTTRFRDPGRGQGLKQIRSRVARWGGKIAIRSGTARIADVPDWDDAPPMEAELAPFPGSQILIVLPAKR